MNGWVDGQIGEEAYQTDWGEGERRAGGYPGALRVLSICCKFAIFLVIFLPSLFVYCFI